MLDATPSISQRPGESKVRHADCRSAGYLCFEKRVDQPERPNHLLEWVEHFFTDREEEFRELLSDGCRVDVYLGIHTNVLALGFNLPATPTLWSLNIPLSVEFFSA
jgi:hypothetical protein